MAGVRYYSLNNNNVARVKGHEYAYLDHESGEWIRHASIADRVHIEASCWAISLDEAKALAKRVAPTLEPEWIDATDT